MLTTLELPSFSDTFPSAYAPLYVEPLLGTGERICVGAGVKCGDDIDVVITDQAHRLSFLFNGPVDGLLSMLRISAGSLKRHLAQEGFDEIARWSSKLGVFVGPAVSCQTPSLAAVTEVALMEHCTLYRHQLALESSPKST